MEILDAKMKKGCRVDLISPRFHGEPRVAWKEEETEKYDVTEHSSFSNSIKIHKVKLFFEKKNYYSVISINENSNRSNSSLSQRIIKKKKTSPPFISFHFVTHLSIYRNRNGRDASMYPYAWHRKYVAARRVELK